MTEACAHKFSTIHALNLGILILMFPPALIIAGITYLAFKKRNSFGEVRQ